MIESISVSNSFKCRRRHAGDMMSVDYRWAIAKLFLRFAHGLILELREGEDGICWTAHKGFILSAPAPPPGTNRRWRP
jgi:hypothetical protein